jgi:hypothetical protein
MFRVWLVTGSAYKPFVASQLNEPLAPARRPVALERLRPGKTPSRVFACLHTVRHKSVPRAPEFLHILRQS